MLIRHSILYFLARGGAGLIAFLAIYVYTRLLSPDEYGIYAMLISSMSIVATIFFQWLNLGLARYYLAYRDRRDAMLSTIMAGFFLAVLATGGLALVAAAVFPYDAIQDWALVTLLLAWSLAWFELNQRLANADLQPIRYGLLSAFKAATGLAVGVGLYKTFGIYGVLAGAFLSALLVPLVYSYSTWGRVRKGLIDQPLLRKLFYYGLPLAITQALTLVVDVSDRFLIAAYRGSGDAGLYSAAYDLAQQALGVPVIVAYLASFPLIIKEVEHGNGQAVKQRLESHIVMLAVVSTPILALFVTLSSNVAEVVLGDPYQGAAETLMPIIAVAIVLGCLKIYYFDLGFQLSHRTGGLVWPALYAALANIVLNILWIPIYGLQGAAYATLAAFSIGLAASAVMARRVFPMPGAPLDLFKVVLAGVVMAGVFVLLTSQRGLGAFLLQCVAGGLAYCAMLVSLNVAQSRTHLLRILSR